ncbi:hypothetical protein HN499_03315, partial [archaeon]|nr:hypothetical protein [archaeon]
MGAALDLTLLSLSTSRPTSDPELDGGQISTEPPTANETISGIKDQVFAKIERSVRRNLSTSGDEMQIRADIGLAFRELYEFEVDIDGLTRQAADVMRTRAAGEIKDKELDLMRGAITDEEAGKDLKRSLGFLSMAHMCDGREEEVCIEYLATLDDATLKKLGKREHRRRNYESEDVIRALLESETERFLSSYDTNDKFEYFSGLTFNVQLKLALKAERRLNLPKAIALRRMILERDDIDPLKDKLESYTHLLNDLKLSGNIVEAREVAEEFWAYLVDLPDTEAKFSREADVVGRMINVFDDLCRFEDELDNDLDD